MGCSTHKPLIFYNYIFFSPKILAGFGDFSYLCSAYKMIVVYPEGRTSDAQLIWPGIFYAIRVVTRNILLRLPSRKIKLALRVEPSSCKQRVVQPFSVHRAGRFPVAYKMMQYATVNIAVRGFCTDRAA